MLRSGFITLLLFLFVSSSAQQDSLDNALKKSRRLLLGTGTAVFAGGSLVYLSQAWYKDHNTGRFHFFDDNAEWLQMDKAGHAFSTYQGTRLMMQGCRWAGFSHRQRLLIGGTAGFFYMTAIEVFDGFSRGWGFSWGDMAANGGGAALAVVQESMLRRQVFQLKFSYFPSVYSKYNPRLLGETPFTQVVKDYNGQVYWISFNPFHLGSEKGSRFPQWLNLALGYGATGMTGGRSNDVNAENGDGILLRFERERLFFLSLDVDLTSIPCRSRALKGFLSALNMVKIPFPAAVFGTGGTTGCLIR